MRLGVGINDHPGSMLRSCRVLPRWRVVALALAALAIGSQPAVSAGTPCPQSVIHTLGIDVYADRPLGKAVNHEPGTCSVVTRNGIPFPDPSRTPGATNPTVTLDVLLDSRFHTSCLRDKATTPGLKDDTYGYYSIEKPSPNSGADQTCEKDHFVPLELGGADTLDNIWPQCGPDGVPLAKRQESKG